MKLVPTLLATALVVGSASFSMAQSGANPTPSGAAPDKSISAATHCLDKATGQPRLKSQTTGGGSVAAGNPTAGDKTAKSTGTSSQTAQSPGKGMAANLPNC